MDAVSRYVQAVLQDERYTEPRFVAWVDQAIAEMRDCLSDQGLELDRPGVAPAALVILMYLRQGMDEYVVQSGMAQEDVAVETLSGGMVALAHLIHQQRAPAPGSTLPRVTSPGSHSPGFLALLRRRLRQARIGRALRLLRNVEARLAWLRRGEARVRQELAHCGDPDAQVELRLRLAMVREEITRTETLLR
ncbi:MAG TPA: hypothetical protein VFA45_17325 [Actinomycetes bacterium]|jgi:hypothetical protein|nr:hypothetical protein [Actinomycetes bacterium]